MSQIPNKSGKQPIFQNEPPKNIPRSSLPAPSFPSGGRSAAISSMIKKTEIDLISSDKNPFGNYRTMLPNNTPSKESAGFNEGSIMGKVEEMVIKKLSEYKDILAVEFKRNLGSLTISDEEKKDIKFLKDNFKIQQSNTDQIISHINQFTQALNEINLLIGSHSEILNKLNVNSPSDKADSKNANKSTIDETSAKLFENKIKSLESQMSETRNMLKQLNESLLIDIKENFKKNLTKIENEQKDQHTELEKNMKSVFDDLKETKILLMDNKRKVEEQNLQFNSFSAHVTSEVSKFSRSSVPQKEANLDPKWGEKVLKMEADLDLMIRRNQGLEKKLDDFLLFQHKIEINEFNDKYDDLKRELGKITEKITFLRPVNVESPERPKPQNEIQYSPPKNENLPIIDDERFNSIIEKTKRNIEMALSNSPLKYEGLDKNIFESPAREIQPEKPAIDPVIKREPNVDDWYAKYKQEKFNIESEIAFKPEVKKEPVTYEDQNKYRFVPEEKPDISLKKFTQSDGKDNKFEPRGFIDDEKFLVVRKKSVDEAELNRQLKMSIDDYGVHYEQKETHIDEILPSFEGMQVHLTESLEQPQSPKDHQQQPLPMTNFIKIDEKGKQEELTPTNDEIVYHLDEEGFLMDEHGNYIVDENEQMIKLSEEHIDYLRKSNMIEDDKRKNSE